MADAQAFRGDEGRGKLRKAAGIGTHELIRRYPNGATRILKICHLARGANPEN